MKDYLNTTEKLTLIGYVKVMEQLKDLTESNLMNSEEKKRIRTGRTHIDKAINSLTNRLNPSALKAWDKSLSTSKMYVSANADIEIYVKRKSADIDKGYEENREYFRLVELIMYYKCKNCNIACKDCEIYKEFENHFVPEYDGRIPLEHANMPIERTKVYEY